MQIIKKDNTEELIKEYMQDNGRSMLITTDTKNCKTLDKLIEELKAEGIEYKNEEIKSYNLIFQESFVNDIFQEITENYDELDEITHYPVIYLDCDPAEIPGICEIIKEYAEKDKTEVVIKL